MRQHGTFLLVALLILVVLVLWSPDFLWRVRGFAERGNPIENEVTILRAENSYLKAQLLAKGSELPSGALPFRFLSANVYSRYPLNFKHELVIGKGERDQVRAGAVVLALIPGETESSPRSFLVGNVTAVTASKSFVQTIFDYRFKDAVHIGPNKVSGLLVGGLSPTVSLIPKDARLSVGDVVVSATPDFPYGLVLGRLKDIRPSSDQLFKEASLELAYDINNLSVVGVEIN